MHGNSRVWGENRKSNARNVPVLISLFRSDECEISMQESAVGVPTICLSSVLYLLPVLLSLDDYRTCVAELNMKHRMSQHLPECEMITDEVDMLVGLGVR